MSDAQSPPPAICPFQDITSSKCKLGIDGHGDTMIQSSKQHFFDNIWQKQPAMFHTSYHQLYKRGDLSELLNMQWDDVADLMENCRQSDSQPLLFQQGRPVTDPHSLYSSNPFAAYLDACSIIVNHADFHSPFVANLCNALQNTFPHVYANSYLTPPNGHAVKAHADDRDVLVIQIRGRKTWKIYRKIPVEYPFEREQVGKNGIEVPSFVLNGDLCFGKEVVMNPGDVLYMPRGFVHEATTETQQSKHFSASFHITIAIATHDWCMSVVLSDAIRQTLSDVTDFRKALPVGPCIEYNSSSGVNSLDRQLDAAMAMIKQQVKSDVLEQSLRAKYDMHNAYSKERRLLTHQNKKRKRCEECVGPDVASRIVLESVVRVSTPDERKSVVVEEGQLRGLTVRQETCPVLMGMLNVLKQDSSLNVRVKDLRDIIDEKNSGSGLEMICDLTLLSFARCCVELGALAMVDE